MKNTGGSLSDKKMNTMFSLDPENLGRTHREAPKDSKGRYYFDVMEQQRELAAEVEM